MAYLGNVDGPAESEILDRLGYEYFGCTPAGLEEDISYHRFAEARNEVAPVHVDDDGRPYVEFSSPERGKIQRFYLEEFGYQLAGKIRTFTKDELERWNVRQGTLASEHLSS